MRYREIKCIILDFDGVILESTEIKTEVFKEIFSRYLSVSEAALNYHLAHRGVSRNEKFRHLVYDLLRINDPTLVRSLAEEFGHMVEARVLCCPFVPGAHQFLERWHRDVPLHVASTAPSEELSRIVERRGLRPYFRSVLAEPGPKSRLIGAILHQEGLGEASAVLIGDSRSDYEAAEESGVGFIGVGDRVDFPALGVPSFKDLFGVHTYLSESKRGGDATLLR